MNFHIVYRKQSKLDKLEEAQSYSKTKKTKNTRTHTSNPMSVTTERPVNGLLANVASLFEWVAKTEATPLRCEEKMTDRYQHQTHSKMNAMIWSRSEGNMNSVYSPLRCTRSLRRTWRHHPWNTTWGFEEDGETMMESWKQKKQKLQSQALKSLMKAASAIFPLPTKYSQQFVKLRIYCCFMAYEKPKTELKTISTLNHFSFFLFFLNSL